MFRTIMDIKNKININNRDNTTYIHPITSNEEIAKIISAYSNSNGGDIIFGIKDDGLTLSIKSFVFELNLKNILNLLEGEVKLQYNRFTYEGNSLFYISIDKSDELIKVDNTAYHINNEGDIEELVFKEVFISYTHKDSDLVDILEKELVKHENIKMTRDTNVIEYRDSLEEFMKTIRNHDFVISIVSSAYIKSLNCMYEVMQLRKNTDYQKKIIFIILNENDINYYTEKNKYENFEANIYDSMDRLNYVTYWSDQLTKLERKIKEANLPVDLMSNLSLDIRKLKSIIPSMDDFIKELSDSLGKSFSEMYENDFKEVIDIINK